MEPPWPGVSSGCHPNSNDVLGPAGAKPSEAQAEPADRNVAHRGTLGSKPRPDPTAIPESETCFVSWIASFLGQLWSSRSCLGSFLRDSLRAPACTSVPEHRSGDLWPVPLPSARWTAETFCNLSPQRRRRGKLFKLVAKLVQLQVGCLNWLALGCPSHDPAHAHIHGAALTDDQHNVLCTLERHCLHFVRAGRFSLATLGRSGEKFSALLSGALELSQADSSGACDTDRLLSEFVCSLETEWCSYGRRPRMPPSPCQPDLPQASAVGASTTAPSCNGPPEVVSVGSGLSCKPVVADRIKWSLPPSFDPVPFLLDPEIKRAYLEPDSVKLPEAFWPKLPRSKVHASRGELLKLAAKWDKFKALRIFKCSEVDSLETVGCFGVPKDISFDRFILNPSVANSRARKLSCYTKLLAPGCLLAQASLPTASHVLRLCCDDLSEMYYTFVVPPLRSKRNCLGIAFQPHELKGFSAYNPVLHNGPCFIALNALAMGDCGAVEYAQQAHFNVLASLGNSMRPSEFVAYRRTFPRSECLEFLSIDDHMTAQVCSRMQLRSKAPLRDTEIFAAADTAYPLVGLVPHPGKRKRQVTSGTFLGADVDGCEGLVSAPRHRIGVLMRITSLVSRHGRCTPALLASILGLWVHILLFRRPVFSILGQVFADARRTPANRVFQLHRDSVNELACLCIMGPLIQADLRAGYPGKIFCMDASPTGAGICCATLPGPVVKELWRHTEQKGFYTKLLEPASALLQSLDLSDDPGAAFVEGLPATSAPFSPEPLPLRAPRSGGGSFLCLFGGDCNWVPAHTRAGLRDFGVERPELSALSFGDLEDRSTFSSLCTLALSGLVHDWHCHPPPASFCGACPDVRFSAVAGLRSCDSPAGLEPVSDELARDNTLARRLCFLLCLAASAGSFVSVSHPAESLLFRLHCFRGLVALGAVATQVSFCAFGSPCQCATTFLHNKPWLHQLGRTSGGCTCPASSPHFASAGRFTIASLAAFCDLCRPDVSAVLGRPPVVGELVSDFSRRYPLPLACRIASGSALACTGVTSAMPVSAFVTTFLSLRFSGLDSLPSLPTDCSFEARQFFDDPEWISELSDCLDFKEVLRYKFLGLGHINVLEARAYKTWLKICSKLHPNSRLVGLIDSRVLLGSAAKGRSASPALCRVLRSSVPYVLGSGLYPGGLHVYSARNRADGPSRGRPPAPPSKPRPLWLEALARGEFRLFDLVCASAAVPRLLGRWLRLLLLLAGDVERNPGPFHSGEPRGHLDMEGGFAVSTRHKMDKALSAFSVWLEATFSLSLAAVLSSAPAAAAALRTWGLYLYSSGQPRYLLVYAITGVQDCHPVFRSHLSPAWQVDRKWQQAEPGECRPVISQPILLAAVSLALCWGWCDWAAVTLVGFLCMLHPSEMICLVRADLVFPEDALSPDPVAYVHIRNPKTQRFARRQHSCLEDPLVLLLLEALYFNLPLPSRLFRGSMHVYRRQWNCIMARLGVPHRLSEKGATPGVLRGSGATFLYLEIEDLPLVAWRGRWSKTKTVEFYLQEVAAQLLLQRLPRWARDRIRLLSSFSRSLVLKVVQDTCLRAQISPFWALS